MPHIAPSKLMDVRFPKVGEGADSGKVVAFLAGADAGAAAPLSLPPSRLKSTVPTVIVSPSLTEMAVIFPPAGEGMGAMAFSDSSSRIV